MAEEHVDKLITGSLRSPMLNEFMVGSQLRTELLAIVNAIKAGYLARVPRETNKLAATARTSVHHSKDHVDRRWYADFTVGGIAGVDYADDVEDRFHPLGNALAALGYHTGWAAGPVGPTGPGAKSGPRKSG